MYYIIHPRLLPQVYECLKERGAQTSNFSSSKDILEMSSTKPRLSWGTLWEEQMWWKARGRENDWNSYIFLFLTRSCLPAVSKMKSVRSLIMHTSLKCNLHNILYHLSLSLQFHFHLLRIIFSSSISSNFFSCQVKVIYPSNLFIPHQVTKIFFMWRWISGPTIPLRNSEN